MDEKTDALLVEHFGERAMLNPGDPEPNGHSTEEKYDRLMKKPPGDPAPTRLTDEERASLKEDGDA